MRSLCVALVPAEVAKCFTAAKEILLGVNLKIEIVGERSECGDCGDG